MFADITLLSSALLWCINFRAERGDLLRLAYTHHFGRLRKISAFAEVTRRLSNNKSSLAVGVSCIVDNLTTAKTTLNDRGKLRPLLLHKIKPNSSLNISAEFNVKALDKIPRMGLALCNLICNKIVITKFRCYQSKFIYQFTPLQMFTDLIIHLSLKVYLIYENVLTKNSITRS